MKVYIDDNEYSASEGETIIQVADRNNIPVSYTHLTLPTKA